jgi:hypothetical protein
MCQTKKDSLTSEIIHVAGTIREHLRFNVFNDLIAKASKMISGDIQIIRKRRFKAVLISGLV